MPHLELTVASAEPDLSVRTFAIREGINELYSIAVTFRSPNPSIDLEAIVGKPASLRVISDLAGGERLWTGLCNHVEQLQPEITGLSTYSISIVPSLWVLTQKHDYRIFQHLSIPDILDQVLDRWHLERSWQIERGSYPTFEYKVQYDETDYAFLSRLTEEAGIAFVFTDGDSEGSKLVLSDRLQRNPARPPLVYSDDPSRSAAQQFVTHVRLSQEVRPGTFTLRDYDFRNPRRATLATAQGKASETRYEQVRYQPGSFLVEPGPGGDTPVADDKGIARYQQGAGDARAMRSLLAGRTGDRTVSFETNVVALPPGTVTSLLDHPHASLAPGTLLLVTDFSLHGTSGQDWHMGGQAVLAAGQYRPPLRTPRPVITGVQTASVVGPYGQEIHTDELGRVRLQFQWDRVGTRDDFSSCWVRVSQGWAGKGFGLFALPRVGQEVLVGFLDGEPDQPIVIGRTYNAVTVVPRKLPDQKNESSWKSDSSPGSGGSSEITFDDTKGEELVYWVAQKNMRRIVKNDETITVGHDRSKGVAFDETDTTAMNRIEVTLMNRTETVNGDKITYIEVDRRKLVVGDEAHTTDGNRRLLVIKDVNLVTAGSKRERLVQDAHLVVQGNRSESILKDQSLIITIDQFEHVAEDHALETGKELNLRSGGPLVGEAEDVTLKGPGGFIRIDAEGVTISGGEVNINTPGGSPRKGRGAHPEVPKKAKQRERDVDQEQS